MDNGIDYTPRWPKHLLAALYVDQHLCMREVGERIGASRKQVRTAMIHYGIPARVRKRKRPLGPPIECETCGTEAPRGHPTKKFCGTRCLKKAVTRRRRIEKGLDPDIASGNWKGDAAGIAAFRKRVEKERGRPKLCEECGATEGRFAWSNQTGHYSDTSDYRRLCWGCHRRFTVRRKASAERRKSAQGEGE